MLPTFSIFGHLKFGLLEFCLYRPFGFAHDKFRQISNTLEHKSITTIALSFRSESFKNWAIFMCHLKFGLSTFRIRPLNRNDLKKKSRILLTQFCADLLHSFQLEILLKRLKSVCYFEVDEVCIALPSQLWLSKPNFYYKQIWSSLNKFFSKKKSFLKMQDSHFCSTISL